jgi:type I restriction enzyme S subunit
VTDTLQPYPEYKDSGLPWLGNIPARWDVRRLKLLLREVDSRSTTGKEQLLRVSQFTGVTQRKPAEGSDEPDTRASSLINYKRVDVNDLVINIMLAWNGSMGVSRFEGIASPAYCVYRFKSDYLPWYYHELLRLPIYKGRIKVASTGVVESRLRLYSDDLGRIESIIPPPSEQAAIVRYLDHAHGRIDRAIRAKRKIITLLNEQKQAIIHRAVTRGLDPSVPLKPSGIPWLGDIPKHWEVRHLRRVCKRIKTGGTPKGADERFFEAGGFNWHTPSDFRDALELGDASRQLSSLGMKEVTVFPANTILMIGIGATIGKVSISRKPCSCNQQINAILPNTKRVHLDFLTYYLRTLRSLIVECGKFTTIPIINQDETKRLPVLIPPFLEQVEIAKHILQSAKPYTTAITNFEREIALLREYRTRLTADVVTGKLDVRAAAASLPDTIDSVESVLSVSSDDPDDLDAGDDPDTEPEDNET